MDTMAQFNNFGTSMAQQTNLQNIMRDHAANFKTGEPFIDTLIVALLSSIIVVLTSKLTSLPEYTTWVLSYILRIIIYYLNKLYYYLKSCLQKESSRIYIKTADVAALNDNKTKNYLYEALLLYVSKEVKLDDEEHIRFNQTEKIETKGKLTEPIKTPVEGNWRDFEFKEYKFKYKLSSKDIYIDENNKNKKNIIIDLSVEVTDPKSRILPEFIIYVQQYYQDYLNDVKKIRKVYVSEGANWKETSTLPDLTQISIIDTLILDGKQKELIVNEINRFKNKDYYYAHGFKYTLTFLLEGLPGTGKSSCIALISALTGRDPRYPNLPNIKTYSNFIQLMTSASLNQSIMCLEDIDLSDLVKIRKTAEQEELEKEAYFTLLAEEPVIKSSHLKRELIKEQDHVQEDLNLAHVLHFLDGNLGEPGQIVVITTNHVNKLDPAVYREGRVTIHMTLLPCDITMIYKMWSRFYDVKITLEEFIANYRSKIVDRVVVPSKLANIFRLNPDSADDALNALFQEFKK